MTHDIVPITRDQFMSTGPWGKEDGFCRAYFSKCDMQKLWDQTAGICLEEKCAECEGTGTVEGDNPADLRMAHVRCDRTGKLNSLAACVTMSISKRQPHVANLQLIHTFSRFRRRGLARELMEHSLRQAHAQGAQYFRVSSEPESVAFYEALGYKFLGRQKSGCQLCMFRIGGPTIADAIWEKDDVIRKAMDSKVKGGVVEEFGADKKPRFGMSVADLERMTDEEIWQITFEEWQNLKPDPDGRTEKWPWERRGIDPVLMDVPLSVITYLKDRREKKKAERNASSAARGGGQTVDLGNGWQRTELEIEGVGAVFAYSTTSQKAEEDEIVEVDLGQQADAAAKSFCDKLDELFHNLEQPDMALVPSRASRRSNSPSLENLGRMVLTEILLKGLGEFFPIDWDRDSRIGFLNNLIEEVVRTAPQPADKPTEAPRPKPAPAPSPPQAGPPPESKPVPAKKEKPPKPKREKTIFMDDDRKKRISRFLDSAVPEGWVMPRVVNIRGTSGSGKSWCVRSFMEKLVSDEWFRDIEPVPGTDGKPRDCYVFSKSGHREIFVVGSYEKPTGGADNISGPGALDRVYDIVERQVTENDRNVLFEGLIVCSDFDRTYSLVSQRFPLEIILLNTPFEKCCENIDARRAARGKPPLGSHSNTAQKYAGNRASIDRFVRAGVPLSELSAEGTVEHLMRILT